MVVFGAHHCRKLQELADYTMTGIVTEAIHRSGKITDFGGVEKPASPAPDRDNESRVIQADQATEQMLDLKLQPSKLSGMLRSFSDSQWQARHPETCSKYGRLYSDRPSASRKCDDHDSASGKVARGWFKAKSKQTFDRDAGQTSGKISSRRCPLEVISVDEGAVNENDDPQQQACSHSNMERSKSFPPLPPPPPSSGRTDGQPYRNQQTKQARFAQVVRSKTERETMNGFACSQCDKWYDAIKDSVRVSKAEKSMCNHSSRHRHHGSPPLTPAGYWDVCSPAAPMTAAPFEPSPPSPEA